MVTGTAALGVTSTAVQGVKDSYNKNVTDEFIGLCLHGQQGRAAGHDSR